MIKMQIESDFRQNDSNSKAKAFSMRMILEKPLRDEAEKMLGKKWDDMTQNERRFSAYVMSAFEELGVDFGK